MTNTVLDPSSLCLGIPLASMTLRCSAPSRLIVATPRITASFFTSTLVSADTSAARRICTVLLSSTVSNSPSPFQRSKLRGSKSKATRRRSLDGSCFCVLPAPCW